MNPTAPDLIRSLSRPLEAIPTGEQAILPTLEGVRAVVFDVYGTLFISGSGDIGIAGSDQQEAALQSILRDLNLAAPAGVQPLCDHLLDCIRKDHADARARGVEFPEVEIRDIWAQALQHEIDSNLRSAIIAYECVTNPVWPMPGSGEILKALRERGVPLGIVSNAQFYTPLLFEAFFTEELPALGFDPKLCFFSYQHRKAKPGPALYTMLREELALRQIEPSETLYIGNDALKDIHPAAQLGFRTALFAGDQRSLRLHQSRSDLNPPDAVITELTQILDLLSAAL